VKPGDTVTFEAVDGTVYQYVVSETEILSSNMYDILKEDWDLTLFTCTYGGTNRVVVRCTLTE
jgi:sortase A